MGKVYVLTNKYMPNIVKIGYTTQPIEDRLKELDKTGVPWPFKCHFAIETDRYVEIEKLVHAAFADHRIRDNREFFEIAPERVVAALSIAGATEIKVDGEAVDERGEKLSEDKDVVPRKKRFDFALCGIPVGAELTFTRDSSKTCKALDSGNVEYDGQVYSLTKLALKLLAERGYNWKTVQGPAFFEFEGKVLTEIRNALGEDNAEE